MRQAQNIHPFGRLSASLQGECFCGLGRLPRAKTLKPQRIFKEHPAVFSSFAGLGALRGNLAWLFSFRCRLAGDPLGAAVHRLAGKASVTPPAADCKKPCRCCAKYAKPLNIYFALRFCMVTALPWVTLKTTFGFSGLFSLCFWAVAETSMILRTIVVFNIARPRRASRWDHCCIFDRQRDFRYLRAKDCTQ